MKLPWQPLKIAALGLGLLVGLGLISWAVTNARATARVAERIAALRAAGEPTTLADLRRKPIPPESNAMTYLDQAALAIKAMVSAVYAVEEQATEEERKAVGDERPSPAILAAMRDALAAHPDVVPLLERAAACPGLDRQWDFNLTSQSFLTSMLTERVSSLRSIWRVLHYQAEVQLADGRRDDALRTCLTMLKLTRLLQYEPCVVNFLVGISVRWESMLVTEQVLTSGPVSPQLHAELEAELARQDLVAAYRESLRSERAFGSDCFRDREVTLPQVPFLQKNEQCDYLDLIAFAIATADRPLGDADVRDEFARVSREAGPNIRACISSIERTRESRFGLETFLHALRVLNAIQAREQAGDASQPQLDKLGLPAEATLDPVNGEPLQIRRTPQGWLIYGVGANLTDDGGQLEDDLDVGVGPSEITPKDQTVNNASPSE